MAPVSYTHLVGTAMARYNFIAVSIFLRAGKTGNHYTVYADRSNDFLHLRIVPYLKGDVYKRQPPDTVGTNSTFPG